MNRRNFLSFLGIAAVPQVTTKEKPVDKAIKPHKKVSATRLDKSMEAFLAEEAKIITKQLILRKG